MDGATCVEAIKEGLGTLVLAEETGEERKEKERTKARELLENGESELTHESINAFAHPKVIQSVLDVLLSKE